MKRNTETESWKGGRVIPCHERLCSIILLLCFLLHKIYILIDFVNGISNNSTFCGILLWMNPFGWCFSTLEPNRPSYYKPVFIYFSTFVLHFIIFNHDQSLDKKTTLVAVYLLTEVCRILIIINLNVIFYKTTILESYLINLRNMRQIKIIKGPLSSVLKFV